MSIVRIAMDGPAGAGKSTIAKRVARELGIDYIDTGAMYRAFALKILRTGTDLKDADALEALLKGTDVDYAGGSIFLDGENVDGLIRTQEVSEMASVSSAVQAVRDKLVAAQQAMGKRKSLVMDGRDIGAQVLHNGVLPGKGGAQSHRHGACGTALRRGSDTEGDRGQGLPRHAQGEQPSRKGPGRHRDRHHGRVS